MSAAPLRLEAPDATSELRDVLRDYLEVTDRLRATHESLTREVERLRGELLSKDREIERRRRLSALGELAAGVAHEVRNPLGAVQLYAGLLRRECGDARAARELLDKIDAAIGAIDGVVADSLCLARQGGSHSCVDVASLIRQACDVCRPVLENHAVTARCEASDGAMLHGDAAALQRVLVNLIANAAQASPRRGIIEITATTEDESVSIHVADRGVGLPEEVLDRVFEPFFSTKPGGTGLGLAIAYRIIEAHGGRLTARNRVAGGAEFIIDLPAGSPASSEQEGTG